MNRILQLPAKCSCGHFGKTSSEMALHTTSCKEFREALNNAYGIWPVLCHIRQIVSTGDYWAINGAFAKDAIIK